MGAGVTAERFRRRPGEIRALRYTGENPDEVVEFGDGCVWHSGVPGSLAVETLHGTVLAAPGDWIVQGPGGDYWPITDERFRATYEAVPNPS